MAEIKNKIPNLGTGELIDINGFIYQIHFLGCYGEWSERIIIELIQKTKPSDVEEFINKEKKKK